MRNPDDQPTPEPERPARYVRIGFVGRKYKIKPLPVFPPRKPGESPLDFLRPRN